MTWIKPRVLSQDWGVYTLSCTNEQSLSGVVVEEISKFGSSWAKLLRRLKYSGLFLLLGVAGGVIYYWRKRKKKGKLTKALHEYIDASKIRSPIKSLLDSLYDDELIEDDMFEFSGSDVKSCYFGPNISSEEDESDRYNNYKIQNLINYIQESPSLRTDTSYQRTLHS